MRATLAIEICNFNVLNNENRKFGVKTFVSINKPYLKKSNSIQKENRKETKRRTNLTKNLNFTI